MHFIQWRYMEVSVIISESVVAEEMVELRKNLWKFDVECIFNVDEAGLIFKLLPTRTCVYRTENARTVRGIKAMNSKDCIRGYTCTNATGRRVPIKVIEKAKNLTCFSIVKPVVL